MTSPVRQDKPLAEAQQFRDAMALLPAPVTVVTTVDEDGQRWGVTASSVTSASLAPPLLLVGLSRASSCYLALTDAPEFVVNVLGDQHREVADRFATHGIDRFAQGDFTTWPGTGLPCLPGAHAVFRCRRHGVVPVGDHDLLVGALSDSRTNLPGTALLWYQRSFHTAH